MNSAGERAQRGNRPRHSDQLRSAQQGAGAVTPGPQAPARPPPRPARPRALPPSAAPTPQEKAALQAELERLSQRQARPRATPLRPSPPPPACLPRPPLDRPPRPPPPQQADGGAAAEELQRLQISLEEADARWQRRGSDPLSVVEAEREEWRRRAAPRPRFAFFPSSPPIQGAQAA